MQEKIKHYLKSALLGVVIVLLFMGIFGGNKKEYETITQEKSHYKSGKREELRHVTDEKLTKEEIDKLLRDSLENDVEFDKDEDDIFIYLDDNEAIKDSGYSLGMLNYREGKLEIDAKEKDWSLQPSEEEYELFQNYNSYYNIYDGIEEKEVLEKVASDYDISIEEVNQVLGKVIDWMHNDLSK